MATINVSRYAPFHAVDELLRGFLVQPLRRDADAQPAQIRVDVSEGEKSYTVRAEIPGVKKEDISVAVEGGQVEISAEIGATEAREGERVLRAERHAGRVYRAFTLAQEVDEAAVQARYADGVLELTLPKKAPAAARRITIQ